MKLGMLVGWSVPELRRMSGKHLLEAWGVATGFSRMKVHCHAILLMAACSVIFNTFMRLTDSFFFDFVGLATGLIIPSNVYFYNVLLPRRAALRQYMEENPDEFLR